MISGGPYRCHHRPGRYDQFPDEASGPLVEPCPLLGVNEPRIVSLVPSPCCCYWPDVHRRWRLPGPLLDGFVSGYQIAVLLSSWDATGVGHMERSCSFWKTGCGVDPSGG
uniref:(northern house mosquito) hypothetical protein n=1 Tax=Culex pipiens TaxID=7175 RepID=A0A8D8FJK3_CULPI